MTERIDYDEKGNLDDVVISDVEMFRLEYMSSGTVWMRLYRGDGKPDVVFWLKSARLITGTCEFE